MNDIERMKAEFAQRGGSVTRVEAGVGLHLSRRQWRELARATTQEREAILHPERYEERDDRITVVTDHAGREFYKNAEGEWL